VDIQKIVAELTADRDQLDRAIAALNSVSKQTKRGRPPKAVQTLVKPKRVRRGMSAAARRKIAAAQRARWAAWRKRKKVA